MQVKKGNKMNKIIGITGGSGSGKTTIVNKISELVSDFTFIPQDNYYKSAKDLLGEEVDNNNITRFNFDHPDAFDNKLMEEHLKKLKNNETILMPQYDFVHHRRKDTYITVKPKKLIIFEGILVLNNKAIRNLIDLKIFVDTPDDIRFIRRLRRDIEQRGRTVESVIEQYLSTVRPGYYEFIEPTKRYADIIIPEGGYNAQAINVLVAFINNILQS